MHSGGGRRAGSPAHGVFDAEPQEADSGTQGHRWRSRHAILCMREYCARASRAVRHRPQQKHNKVTRECSFVL